MCFFELAYIGLDCRACTHHICLEASVLNTEGITTLIKLDVGGVTSLHHAEKLTCLPILLFLILPFPSSVRLRVARLRLCVIASFRVIDRDNCVVAVLLGCWSPTTFWHLLLVFVLITAILCFLCSFSFFLLGVAAILTLICRLSRRSSLVRLLWSFLGCA